MTISSLNLNSDSDSDSDSNSDSNSDSVSSSPQCAGSVITNLRKIRSFVRREGRLTRSQERALKDLYPVYGVNLPIELDINLKNNLNLNSQTLFQNNQPLILEIGFGMGQSLIQMAKSHPDLNYLGLEVHRPGVGHILLDIEKENLKNLKVLCHDAVEILEKYIPDDCLEKIQIFFPDPWHKKKHHKRRLIQEDFIKKLILKLKISGQIHLATDWENYAEQMLNVLSDNKNLVNIYGDHHFAPDQESTGRPLTKFQKRGENLGHGVWDLIFKKI